MIKRYVLDLEVEGKMVLSRPDANWAYALYSGILDTVDNGYADLLHIDGLNPISQFVLFPDRNDGSRLQWHVNLLGTEAIERIGSVLEGKDRYCIDRLEAVFRIARREVGDTITEQDFCRRYLLQGSAYGVNRVEFLTPSTFKSNEQYAAYPTADLILKSAVAKWNAYSMEFPVEDPQAFEQMSERALISQYRLRSASFRMKQRTIHGFLGSVDIKSRGPEPMLRLVNLLLGFLNHSGVGIKSTLGMGACRVTEKSRYATVDKLPE